MAIEEIQPTTINAIQGMVPKAYALLAGAQLDVFTALRDGPLTVDEIARTVGGDRRRLSSLLYYLAASELLTVSDSRFANTPETDRWLVRGRPGSYAAETESASDFYAAHSKTAESIRAGHPLAEHDFTTMPPDELRVVYHSLDRTARAKGKWLADTFDFSTCNTLVDAGGGSGGLCVTLTERHPHIRATVAELPSVVPVAEQFLEEAGATNRVGVLGVDLLAGPLPGTYDAAVANNLIQVFGPDDARRVLSNIGAAIRPGGTLYILGFALEDTRLGPEPSLYFNFISISVYEKAQAPTESETYRAWLAEAGFGEVEFRWKMPVTTLLIVARKRG